MKYVIYDLEDYSYHTGNGLWGEDEGCAELYDTAQKAAQALEDVDGDGLLLNRLVIKRVEE